MRSKYEEEKKLNPELYLIFKTFNSDNVIFDYSSYLLHIYYIIVIFIH